MEYLGAILSIVAAVVSAVILHYRNKEAGNTPEKRRDDDVQKFDQALDHGSDTDVSVMLDDLLVKTDSKNNLSGPNSNKAP